MYSCIIEWTNYIHVHTRICTPASTRTCHVYMYMYMYLYSGCGLTSGYPSRNALWTTKQVFQQTMCDRSTGKCRITLQNEPHPFSLQVAIRASVKGKGREKRRGKGEGEEKEPLEWGEGKGRRRRGEWERVKRWEVGWTVDDYNDIIVIWN